MKSSYNAFFVEGNTTIFTICNFSTHRYVIISSDVAKRLEPDNLTPWQTTFPRQPIKACRAKENISTLRTYRSTSFGVGGHKILYECFQLKVNHLREFCQNSSQVFFSIYPNVQSCTLAARTLYVPTVTPWKRHISARWNVTLTGGWFFFFLTMLLLLQPVEIFMV